MPLTGPLLEAYQAHKHGSEKLQAIRLEVLVLLNSLGEESEVARKKFWDLAAQALGYADTDAVHAANFGMQVRDGSVHLIATSPASEGQAGMLGTILGLISKA